MTTIYDRVMNWRLNQEYKHEMPEGTAEAQINEMPLHDFLRELSEAIEYRLNPPEEL